ncbi:MAG TPA: hypothetical protein PLW48_10440 [Alphaproteobacteria bacterium]|nr:hypothetical protein [Alphaproteobacteria bacterium]
MRHSFHQAARRHSIFSGVVMTAVAVAFAGAVGGSIYYQTAQPETVRAMVTDKERQVSSDSDGNTSSKYIVFTDKEVFENTDSVMRGKWRSSDLQGNLHAGCTYDFNVYGFRNGLFSMYRNIVDAKHVRTEACPTNKPAAARTPQS